MKNKNNKRRKGFTLIELIVVIAILAILAAVAVPNFIGMTNRAQTATEVAAAAEYANAINIYNTLAAEDDRITGIAVGAMVTADVAGLGTELTPVTPDITDVETYVLKRIAVDADGIAKVSNKADIAN
ncbi:MAG: prepilin-type N-terminal cleavage/methylation domain-containing protein [Saccharofermentanales bacterium]